VILAELGEIFTIPEFQYDDGVGILKVNQLEFWQIRGDWFLFKENYCKGRVLGKTSRELTHRDVHDDVEETICRLTLKLV